jgi:hypothetical protein
VPQLISIREQSFVTDEYLLGNPTGPSTLSQLTERSFLTSEHYPIYQNVPYQRRGSSSAAIELQPNGERNWQESAMTVIAKVIQRLEPSSAIRSSLIPDFATLMLITRFAPYRPELHYMRGPGAKWHVKHDPRAGSLDGVLGGLKTSTDVAARPITNS